MGDKKSVINVWQGDGITGNYVGLPVIKGNNGITPHIGENGNWWIGKTDTGVAASGGGGGSDPDAVKYVEQTLTEEQQSQARENIGIPQIDTEQVTYNGIPTGQALTNFLPQYISNSGAVMYEAQNYPVELQEIARQNIGINVVSNLTNGTQVPNGDAVNSFVRDYLNHSELQYSFDFLRQNVVKVIAQEFTDQQKQIARKNIDVDGGKWEKLHTFAGDGETASWELSQFTDGTPLKLKAVAIRLINTGAYSKADTVRLYTYHNNISLSRAFISNALNTQTKSYAVGLIFPFMGIYAGIGMQGGAYTGAMNWVQDSGFDLTKTVENMPYIDRVKVDNQTNNNVMKDITNIEIWGVRYHDV